MPAILSSIGATVLAALGTAGPVTAGAATAAGIATAAAAGGAGYGLYKAGAAAGEAGAKGIAPPVVGPAPVLPALLSAPAPQKAEDLAKAEIERQKRIRALAGGKTILASEGPTLSAGAGKTLLGE